MGRRINGGRRGRGAVQTRKRCVEALARSIADRCARADIEEFCEREGDQYVVPVFPWAGAKREDVWKATAYLDLRGLLEHGPMRPNIVRLL